jgi:hypothetical protein
VTVAENTIPTDWLKRKKFHRARSFLPPDF